MRLIGQRPSIAALFVAGQLITISTITSCGKESKNSPSGEGTGNGSGNSLALTVNAMSLESASQNAALSLLKKRATSDSPEAPETAAGEYDGMGVSSADAVVEGFVIKLTTITFSQKIEGGMGNSSELDAGEVELDISSGVNSPVTVTGNLNRGIYDSVAVGVKPWYRLKAYAYMDGNNDGTIDTTVFTTAAEVKKETGRLTMAQLNAAGYAAYEYGFTYTHCSNSITNSTEGSCGTISLFPKPINVEGNVTEPKDEDGDGEPDQEIIDPSTKEVVVNLLIDSTKVVTAWNGEVGTYQLKGDVATKDILGDTTLVPFPRGFPVSNTCSDTPNQWGLDNCDFFPVGKPAFKLNYLPAFAFLETDGLSSHVYSVSKEEGSFNHYNSGTIQIVFNGTTPTVGLVFNDPSGAYDFNVKPAKFLGSTGPVLGSVARIFEKQADGTYTFHMDGSSVDANGKDDGGMYYNNDKSMAGYIVTKFTPATAVGGTGTIVVSDGPRCKGEYDYCIGDRTYFWKRIK